MHIDVFVLPSKTAFFQKNFSTLIDIQLLHSLSLKRLNHSNHWSNSKNVNLKTKFVLSDANHHNLYVAWHFQVK